MKIASPLVSHEITAVASNPPNAGRVARHPRGRADRDERYLCRVGHIGHNEHDVHNGTDLVPIARVRVSERIDEILGHLQERVSVTLEEILRDEHSRFVIIVTFLAVLELWKWQRISVSQDELMGPILLTRGEKWAEALDKDVVED